MDEDVAYAGFWVRVGATLIDALLIMLAQYRFWFQYMGPGISPRRRLYRARSTFCSPGRFRL